MAYRGWPTVIVLLVLKHILFPKADREIEKTM